MLPCQKHIPSIFCASRVLVVHISLFSDNANLICSRLHFCQTRLMDVSLMDTEISFRWCQLLTVFKSQI